MTARRSRAPSKKIGKRRRASATGDLLGEAERFVIEEHGPDLAYEHLHRYALAARVVVGLRVLNLACGSDYGSAILRAQGAEVFSLDLSSAAGEAGPGRVRGLAERLPFASGSFDVVVFFEAIEHIPEAETVLDEIVRILRGPRILLISTPDREIYTDRAGHVNPYHCSELSRSEFGALLRARFRSVAMHGQSLWAGSWVARLAREGNPPGLGVHRVEAIEDPHAGGQERTSPAPWTHPDECWVPTPLYLLAACADSPEGRRRLQKTLPAESVLHDPRQWLVGRYFAGLREAEEHVRQLDRARAAAEDLESQVLRARKHGEESSREIEALRTALDEREAELVRARAELERGRASQQRIEGELAAARIHHQDQEAQIREARQAQMDLELQLEQARTLHEEQIQQIEAAREAQTDLERQLTRAREHHQDQEAQIDAAREAQMDLELQLEEARTLREEEIRQTQAARDAQVDLEQQLTQAREHHQDQEAQIDAAREAQMDLELQLEEARTLREEQIRQIEAAREAQTDLEQQLTRAREHHQDQEAQIDAAREAQENLKQQLAASQRRESDLAEQIRREHQDGEVRKRELEARTREAERLRHQLEESQSKTAELEQRVRAMGERIEQLEASIEPRIVRMALAVSRASRRVR